MAGQLPQQTELEMEDVSEQLLPATPPVADVIYPDYVTGVKLYIRPWSAAQILSDSAPDLPPDVLPVPAEPSWLTPGVDPLEVLRIAIMENGYLIVKKLMTVPENRELLLKRDEDGRNMLHLATLSRHKECVQVILKVVSTPTNNPTLDESFKGFINRKDKTNRETALHIATRIGWFEGACLLLDAKADITAKNKSKKTVLHLVMSAKKSPEQLATLEEFKSIMEKLLMHQSCNYIIGSLDGKDHSPLCLGIICGSVANQRNSNFELITLLLKKDNDIHQNDRPALFFAAETNQPEILQLLIKKAKERYEKSNSELTEYLNQGFQSNSFKLNALHIAILKGSSKCVEQLLEAGSDMQTGTLNGKEENVFHLAAMLQDSEVMSVLMKHLEKLKKNKLELLKEIHKELNFKSTCLNQINNLSDKIKIAIDKIDKKLQIANESKLKNDPSIWECVNTNLPGGPVIEYDRRITRKNNSEKMLSLFNEKDNLLNKQAELLNAGVSGLSQENKEKIELCNLNIVRNQEEITKIDTSWESLKILTEDGLTPLEIACENSSRDSIKLLIQAGADLTVKCANPVHRKSTLLHMIMHCVPSSVDLFQEVFDSSIKLEKEYVEVDFKVLLPENTKKDNFKIINAFLSTGNKLDQQKLLEHPLVQSFLQLQWEKQKHFYFVLTSLYLFFVLSLNFLLYTRYIVTDMYPMLDTISTAVTIVSIILLIFYIEISYYFTKIVYEKQKIELFIKASCYIITIVILKFRDFFPEITVTAVCLSLLEFINLLSNIPRYGTNLLIFKEVASTYLIVIISFSFIIIQFMFVFMVLFRQNESLFNTVSDSLTKIVVMMTGEVEYDGLFQKYTADNALSLYFVQFLIVVFILLVGTVLVNLLIAKAVIDVKKIDRIRIQATSMIVYEHILFGNSPYSKLRRNLHATVTRLANIIEKMFVFFKKPHRELFSDKWKKNSLTVFKMQLIVMDRSYNSVPIDNNVVNLILNQGFINTVNISAQNKLLLNEFKKFVLVTMAQSNRPFNEEKRNGDRFKSFVTNMMANQKNTAKLQEKETLLKEIKSAVSACIKEEISNLATQNK